MDLDRMANPVNPICFLALVVSGLTLGVLIGLLIGTIVEWIIS
jgi:hypothetical protein